MENISLDKSKGKIKIGEKERNILKKLKKNDTFGKLDKVKPIWDEIGNYDVEDVDIGIKCSKYLNKAGKTGLLPINSLFTECYKLNKYKKTAEIQTKREAKSQQNIGTRQAGGRKGRRARMGNDAKLTKKVDEGKIDAKYSPQTATDLLQQFFPNASPDKIREITNKLSKQTDSVLTTTNTTDTTSTIEEEKLIKKIKALSNITLEEIKQKLNQYKQGLLDDDDDLRTEISEFDKQNIDLENATTFDLNAFIKKRLEEEKKQLNVQRVFDRIPAQGEVQSANATTTSLLADVSTPYPVGNIVSSLSPNMSLLERFNPKPEIKLSEDLDLSSLSSLKENLVLIDDETTLAKDELEIAIEDNDNVKIDGLTAEIKKLQTEKEQLEQEIEEFKNVEKVEKVDVAVGEDNKETGFDKANKKVAEEILNRKLNSISRSYTNKQFLEEILLKDRKEEDDLVDVLTSFNRNKGRLLNPIHLKRVVDEIPGERFIEDYDVSNLPPNITIPTKKDSIKAYMTEILKGKSRLDNETTGGIYNMLITNFKDFEDLHKYKPLDTNTTASTGKKIQTIRKK